MGARGQGGADNIIKMLLAGSKHQQGFGTQIGLCGRVEQQLAQGFTHGGAARLAGKQYRQIALGKPLAHGGQMGGFSGTVDAV